MGAEMGFIGAGVCCHSELQLLPILGSAFLIGLVDEFGEMVSNGNNIAYQLVRPCLTSPWYVVSCPVTELPLPFWLVIVSLHY